MGEYIHEGLSLAVKHLPDFSMETDANGVKNQVPLPGFVQFGAEIEGVFVPLFTRKAGGLFDAIERLKRQQGAEAPAVPADPSEPAA